MKHIRKTVPRLRRKLLLPLGLTFALLWLGTMALFTSDTCRQLDEAVNTTARSIQSEMQEDWEYCHDILAPRLGDEAANILRENLSMRTMGNISSMDGGIALSIRTSQGLIRSQLAWGWGYQSGMEEGQKWYLLLDEGLDDQGQLDLARWIMAHRSEWYYTVYPAGSGESADGSFARVTGVEQPGYAIAVEKIEIVHPDGTAEVMMEAPQSSAESTTWEFSHFQAGSVLLPSWSEDGDGTVTNGPSNMERRLASFREAQAIVDRELAGQSRVVQTDTGFLLGGRRADGTAHCLAVECDVLPTALRQDSFLYLSTAILTLLVLLVLSACLSRQVTEPVEALCREAEQGHCRSDGPIRELNTLAAAFNESQSRLALQLQRERDFTRSAAHELKTPLAVLRAHAEAAWEDIAPQKRQEYLGIVLEESDRMADLVNRLLELSRLESDVPLERADVELSGLIRAVWKPLQLSAEQKEITLSLQLEELHLMGDQTRLKEMAENLASNALRHCPAGGRIQVSLTVEGDNVRLTVDNDGPQIFPEDLPHVWEPFYRGDKSHSRESGGTGLGLAIVRAAAQAHGGSCGVENRPGGVTFWVLLPQVPSGQEP